MSNMKHCAFCTLRQPILKENSLAILFLSNPRKMPGHFLVSPKRHVEKPWELTPEEMTAIFDLVLFVQKRITERLAAGCDVRQNYRPFLKQSRLKVDHIHYHVMPRNFEDTLYEAVEKHETALFSELSDDELDEMALIVS